jgi:uncharacterized membrane protein YjgN (DUF898 family)
MNEEKTLGQSLNNKQVKNLIYVGDTGELFKIWLKNLFLNIITLFIYRSWAKTRIRRYLWSKTVIAGDNLTYHGTGGELFKGVVKVVAISLIIAILLIAISVGFGFLFGTGEIKLVDGVNNHHISQALLQCGYQEGQTVDTNTKEFGKRM